jgi:Lon protease-like protein
LKPTLPLFPLHTVLFPGRVLPLHIFEPRYRLMIGRCLEHGSPFGVVLIRAGREVGEPAEPYDAGTVAEIVRHERLANGRLNLLCVGRERFRVRDMVPGEPYAVGMAEELVDEPVGADAEALSARLTAGLTGYLAMAGVEGPELPTDPTVLSFAVPGALPLELAEQQALLEMTSVAERLRWLLGALERESRLRRRVGETQPAHPHTVRHPSAN